MKRFMKGLMVAGMVAAMTTSAFAKTASIKVGESETKLDISGFVQAAYVSAENKTAMNNIGGNQIGIGDYMTSGNDTFTLNRLQLTFAAKPNDNITVKSTVELGRNFNTATNDTRVVDAIIDLAYVPGMTVRVGQFPTPIGFEIEKSPVDLDFINYTLLTTMLAERTRGAMIYGDLSEVFSYDLGFGNQMANGSLTGAGNQASNDGKQIFGRLGIVPLQNWNIALSAAYEKAGIPTSFIKQKNTVLSLGSNYSYANWYFEGAYGQLKMDNAANTANVNAKIADMYGAITYLIPQTDLKLVARYERDKLTVTGANAAIAKVLTVGANWAFDKNASVQLQREFWSSNSAATPKVNNSDLTVLQLNVKF